MDGLKDKAKLLAIKLLNASMLTLPFSICWYEYYAPRTASPYFAKGNWLIIALFFLLHIVYARVYDGFLISLCRISEILYSQSLAALLSDAILYIVTWLLAKHLPNALPLLLAFGGQILCAGLWAILAHRWYFATFPVRKTAIIYDDRRGMEKLIAEYGINLKFQVCAISNVHQCLQNLSMLDTVDSFFVSGVHSHDRNIILKYCIAKNIEIYVIPRVGAGDIIETTKKTSQLCVFFAA